MGAVNTNFDATNGGGGGTAIPLWYVNVRFAPDPVYTIA